MRCQISQKNCQRSRKGNVIRSISDKTRFIQKMGDIPLVDVEAADEDLTRSEGVDVEEFEDEDGVSNLELATALAVHRTTEPRLPGGGPPD